MAVLPPTRPSGREPKPSKMSPPGLKLPFSTDISDTPENRDGALRDAARSWAVGCETDVRILPRSHEDSR
jgi:hypothetical protein